MHPKLLLFLTILVAGQGCDEERTTISLANPSFNQAYNYFPSQDGYEWTYDLTINDIERKVISRSIEVGRYNGTTQTIVFFVENTPTSTAHWYNSGSRLLCCDGDILLDYSKLDCAEDSVLIRRATTEVNKTFVTTFQHCEQQELNLEGYEKTKSISSIEHNTFNDGSQLIINRHFGYGVGLIFEQQTFINLQGNITETRTKQLKSHQF